MDRIRIDFPDDILFTTEWLVRVNDLNYGGHVGNDRYLTFAHEARVQFIEQLGFTELDVDGAGMIQADAAIQYKSEAFLHELLTIDIGIDNISRVGCRILYRISCGERPVALVQTGIVFYNYDEKKVVSIPTSFLKALERSVKDRS